jgi:hypothetical protein
MDDRIDIRQVVFVGISDITLDYSQVWVRPKKVAKPLNIECSDFVSLGDQLGN